MTEKPTDAVDFDNLNNRQYFLFHPFPERTFYAEMEYNYWTKKPDIHWAFFLQRFSKQ